jgi:hypothetical protein
MPLFTTMPDNKINPTMDVTLIGVPVSQRIINTPDNASGMVMMMMKVAGTQHPSHEAHRSTQLGWLKRS